VIRTTALLLVLCLGCVHGAASRAGTSSLTLELMPIAVDDEYLRLWLIVSNTSSSAIAFSDSAGFADRVTNQDGEGQANSITASGSCLQLSRQHRLLAGEHLFVEGRVKIPSNSQRIKLDISMPLEQLTDDLQCTGRLVEVGAKSDFSLPLGN
jgi:hypothetical protein